MRCRRKERIKTIAFGFPDNAVFIDGTGKKIKWQNYKKKKLRDLLQYNRIDRFLNEVYRDKDDGINSQGNDKYKVTAAIAKMYFDNPVNGSNKLECICYPSVSGLAGATNYAFPKKIADKVLEPDSFYVFEICSGGKYGNFALKIVCFSLNYTNNGKIEWENIILR
jgi:hypothetical protein